MNVSRRTFIRSAAYDVAATGLAWKGISTPAVAKGNTVKLFNGRNFDGWYTFLRTKGKNNDTEDIFKVEDKMIHVLGKEFGYLSTVD